MDKREAKLGKHLHLSVKLGFLSFIITVVIFGLLSGFSLWNLASATHEQYKNKAISFSRVISSAISDSKILADQEALQILCENIAQNEPSITEISVFALKDGRIVKVSGNSRNISEMPVYLDKTFLSAVARPTWKERRDLNGRQVLTVFSPIHVSGKPKAWLSINVDLAPRSAALMQRSLILIAGILTAFIALLLLLSLSFKKEVFSPLAKLLASARVALGGSTGSPAAESQDELGELSHELDNIAQELQHSKEENDKLALQLQEKWHEAESMSGTDFLTGLENYRSFQERLDAEINRASRSTAEVSLLFFDIDGFRSFNEANGPLAGDRALFEIAQIMKRSVRDYDVVARYGADEFTIIVNETDAEMALAIGERLRATIANHEFSTTDGVANLTVSIGVATYPTDATKKELLVAAAEFAVNKAKEQGGDQVYVFQPTEHGEESFNKAS